MEVGVGIPISYPSGPGAISCIGGTYGWYIPSFGSADYFHTNATSTDVQVMTSTPVNTIYGDQKTAGSVGNGYCGVWNSREDNGAGYTEYREYMAAKLQCPLTIGRTYRVTYYVAVAKQWATRCPGASGHQTLTEHFLKNIDLKFLTVDPNRTVGTIAYGTLQNEYARVALGGALLAPEVSSYTDGLVPYNTANGTTYATIPHGFNDNTTWLKVTKDVFASAAWEWILMGNFTSNLSTEAEFAWPATAQCAPFESAGEVSAYYFIDNVSIIPVDNWTNCCSYSDANSFVAEQQREGQESGCCFKFILKPQGCQGCGISQVKAYYQAKNDLGVLTNYDKTMDIPNGPIYPGDVREIIDCFYKPLASQTVTFEFLDPNGVVRCSTQRTLRCICTTCEDVNSSSPLPKGIELRWRKKKNPNPTTIGTINETCCQELVLDNKSCQPNLRIERVTLDLRYATGTGAIVTYPAGGTGGAGLTETTPLVPSTGIPDRHYFEGKCGFSGATSCPTALAEVCILVGTVVNSTKDPSDLMHGYVTIHLSNAACGTSDTCRIPIPDIQLCESRFCPGGEEDGDPAGLNTPGCQLVPAFHNGTNLPFYNHPLDPPMGPMTGPNAYWPPSKPRIDGDPALDWVKDAPTCCCCLEYDMRIVKVSGAGVTPKQYKLSILRNKRYDGTMRSGCDAYLAIVTYDKYTAMSVDPKSAHFGCVSSIGCNEPPPMQIPERAITWSSGFEGTGIETFTNIAAGFQPFYGVTPCGTSGTLTDLGDYQGLTGTIDCWDDGLITLLDETGQMLCQRVFDVDLDDCAPPVPSMDTDVSLRTFDVDVMPNPANTIVSFYGTFTDPNARLTMYTLAGGVAMSMDIKLTNPVDVATLANGTYIIVLQNAGKTAVKRLVINH